MPDGTDSVTGIATQGFGSVAGLPMYDLPETVADHEALWQAIAAELRRRGVPAPAQLTRAVGIDELWRHPDLLLAQMCAWPFVTGLSMRLRVVGAFGYAVGSGGGPTYRSQLVARAGAGIDPGDLGRPGLSIAVNALDSLSGWVSLHGMLAATGGRWQGAITITGSHVASVEDVVGGRADVALVDEVTLALLHSHRPHAMARVEVFGQGPSIPCLPLVVRRAVADELAPIVREALAAVVADPELAAVRARLLIRCFHPVGDDHCAPVCDLRPPAT